MSSQEPCFREILHMIQAAVFYQFTGIGIVPAHILIGAVKIVIKHEPKLCFNLIRLKFIIVIQKCEVLTSGLRDSVIARCPSPSSSCSMNDL